MTINGNGWGLQTELFQGAMVSSEDYFLGA